MILTYDQEKQFEATAGFISALETLGREYLKMMREADAAYSDSWAYCDIVLGDVADASFVELLCGGDEDKPEDMVGEVRVRVRRADGIDKP